MKIRKTTIKRLITRIRLRTWISIGLIAIILPIIIIALYVPSNTMAEWFDDSYLHRQPFSFTHNAAISNPRSVTFTLDTAELIAAGVMQSDCDDTRFTDSNGNLLYHDLTGTCNNASTTYEVIFNSIKNGLNTAHVYYGSSNATNREVDSTLFTALTPSSGDPSAITDRTNEEVTQGPSAYWKFDEAANDTCAGGSNDVCDSSGQGNDGAITGATWRTSEYCLSGKCLYFDGSGDYVQVDSPSLPTGDFTYSFWMKPISDSNNYMFSAANGASSEIFLTMNGTNTSVGLNGTSGVVLGSLPTKNQWVHVAVSRSGSSVKLYFDGRQIASGTDANTLDFSTCPFFIGTSVSGATCTTSLSSSFHGFIDEMKIYPYARSTTQIQSDYISRGSNQGNTAQIGAQGSYLSDGLVAHWKLDENTANTCTGGVNDSCDNSGNSVDGAWQGDATAANGKFGKAVTFDGTGDYISFADNDLFDFTNQMSITAWVNTDGGGNYQRIVSKMQSDESTGFMLDRTSTGTVRFRLNSQDCETTQTLTDNIWNHVGASYDGNKIRILINGNISKECDYNSTITANTYIIAVGNRSDNNSPWDGEIDDVRIFNKAITSNQIKQIYKSEPGPLLYYSYDQNKSTSTIYDESGFGNNGSLDGSMSLSNWVSGKYGGALEFDGTDDSITIDQNWDSQMTSFTLSSWIYIDSLDGTTGEQYRPFTGWTGDFGQPRIRIFGDGDWAMQFNTSGSVGVSCTDNGKTIEAGKWVHIAVSWNDADSECSMYYNGAVVWKEVPTVIGSMSNGTGNTVIAGTTNLYFNGKIDETKIYNYTRSDSLILQDLNGGHPIGGSPVGSQVIYYNFDENYGTTTNNQITVNSALSGTLTSGPTWTDSGCKYTNCLDFDGTDDYINVVNADEIDMDVGLSSAFTFSAWINPDTAGEGSAGQIFVKNTSTYCQLGGTAPFNITCSVNQATDATVTVNSAIPASTWTHIALGYTDDSDDEITVYINGQARGTSTNGVGPLDTDASNLFIGGGTSNNFDGKIDDFKLYSTELTAPQILIDHSANSAINFGTGTNELTQITGSAATPPVGYWNFDENTGTSAFDKSGNGTTVTLENTEWRTGKFGSAMYMSSNDLTQNADAANASVLQISGDLSVSLWINSTTIQDGDQIISVRAGGETEVDNEMFLLEFDTGSGNDIQYQHENGAGVNNSFIFDTNLSANTWYNIQIVRNVTANTVKMFVDGVQTSSTYTYTNDPTGGSNSNLRIGLASTSSSSSRYQGYIDEIKIYNYARTNAQVAYDYNRGKPILHYKFDECSGTTLYDSAPFARHGVITIGGTGTYTAPGTCGSGTASHAWNGGTTGKRNASLGFDGSNDYVYVASPNLPTGDFTYSVWFYHSNDSTDNVFTALTSNASRNEIALRAPASGSSGDVRVTVGSTTTVCDGAQTISLNRWYHYVFTRSGSTVTGYLDGIQDCTGTKADTLDFGSCYLVIGADDDSVSCGSAPSTFTSYWEGKIDDLRVYNYAISPAQVKTIMNEGAVRFGPNEGSPE